MPTNTESPLVSVVAVSYNHERWILETLESIKAQTFGDFELIYADDCSGDRSAETALTWLAHQSFPVTNIIHEKNHGLCATLNEALIHCRGRYLQIIACDDVLLPDKLASHVALLEAAAPDVALVHSMMKMIDADGQPVIPTWADDEFLPTAKQRANTETSFERALKEGTILYQTALIKCDAIRAVGGYDERLSFEDWDMSLRLLRAYRFVFQPKVTIVNRVLPSGLHNHVNPVDHYWIVRKHVDRADARAALRGVAYRLYAMGNLPNEVRRDFLACVHEFPDMRVRLSDFRTFYNGAIRMKVPPMLFTPMRYSARGLQRFARVLGRAHSA